MHFYVTYSETTPVIKNKIIIVHMFVCACACACTRACIRGVTLGL